MLALQMESVPTIVVSTRRHDVDIPVCIMFFCHTSTRSITIMQSGSGPGQRRRLGREESLDRACEEQAHAGLGRSLVEYCKGNGCLRSSVLWKPLQLKGEDGGKDKRCDLKILSSPSSKKNTECFCYSIFREEPVLF